MLNFFDFSRFFVVIASVGRTLFVTLFWVAAVLVVVFWVFLGADDSLEAMVLRLTVTLKVTETASLESAFNWTVSVSGSFRFSAFWGSN